MNAGFADRALSRSRRRLMVLLSRTNRDRHLRALDTAIPSFTAIAVFPNPSAAASTIRARTANPFDDVVRRDHATNSVRSASDNVTTAAIGLGIARV